MNREFDKWVAMWFRPFETWSPIVSRQRGKSQVQELRGPDVYRFLLSAGLITNHYPYPNPYIQEVWNQCNFQHVPGHNAGLTFNPKSWFGKEVLSYSAPYFLIYIVEAILEGTLFRVASVQGRRILPLLAKKKILKKRYKSPTPKVVVKPATQIELEIPLFSHIRIRFHTVIITPPYLTLCMQTPDHESLRSKPREGVG